jgi:thiamine biosynthesis lipoprotein
MGVEVGVGGATDAELAAVRACFERWEQAFSRFRPDSELSLVNRSESELLIVSQLFADAVRTALAAAAATGGAVDPTLGRAIEAAGYDRDFSRLADDPRPAGAPAAGRWRDVRIEGRVLVRPRGLRLDLNGVVKGLAADAALELVAAAACFVDAGGDVAARGALDVALPGGGAVRLQGGGIATSGTSRRRWLRGGEAQHHLLDARTGRPAGSRWSDVTVAAGSCCAADVAAKTAFLLSDDGPDWLHERGLAGRFLAADGLIVTTSGWPDDGAATAAVWAA